MQRRNATDSLEIMFPRKCLGYYSICRNENIPGMQFETKEDGKIHYYCIRCVLYGIKIKHFDEKDILSKAPFIKPIYDKIVPMTDDDAMKYLRGLKPSPITSLLKVDSHENTQTETI